MDKRIYNRSMKIILIFVLGAICCLLLLSHRYNEDGYKRYILPTKHALEVSRINIQKFNEIAGHYPEVANGKIIFDVKNDAVQFDQLPIKEYISCREGNDSIFNEFNGHGGWFYDRTNGKIYLNLTMPINKYLRFYWGKYSNEIPSKW